MHRRASCVSIVLACVATGAILVAAAPASAFTAKVKFENWAVWGTLTPKKLNEPVTLPKGSVFNGVSELTEPANTGTVRGHLTVPPFTASLKLAGLVPT